MKKLYSFILISVSQLTLFANQSPEKHVPLERLASLSSLQVNIEGTGGYQDECIQFIVRNLSNDSVHIKIEAGRKLNSLDDDEQDILVVKDKLFSLGKNQVDTISVQGYCCESSKSAPEKNSKFSIGVMAPLAWLALTHITNKFNFPKSAIQNAIWVLSDNHDIRSIPAYNNEETDQLRHTVAKILDIELPWYSFTYQSDSNHLFTGIKTHLFAEVPIDLPFQALIIPHVENKKGQIIFEGTPQHFRAGKHSLCVNIPLVQWHGEDYSLYLMEDFHTVHKKLDFNLHEIDQ